MLPFPPKCESVFDLLKQSLSNSDDEYVGDSDYFQQPTGRTSVLTGFVYISKLFRSTHPKPPD